MNSARQLKQMLGKRGEGLLDNRCCLVGAAPYADAFDGDDGCAYDRLDPSPLLSAASCIRYIGIVISGHYVTSQDTLCSASMEVCKHIW